MAMTLKHSTSSLQKRPPVIGQEREAGCRNEMLTDFNVMMSVEESSTSSGGLGKPPVPPKPSKLDREEDVINQFQSPPPSKLSEKLSSAAIAEASPPHTTGSETSRSFHPEGSIDLSPSCSESLPTTPSYLKWAESMQYLLDDGDGVSLFKYYLDQQSLGHLLEFLMAVKGFKIQMAELQPASDQDLLPRLVKTINKRYVNSLGRNLSSRIECLSPDQRKSLEEKITTKVGLDPHVFDDLYATVIEHLESKCYPNFLTSEVYIEHVQSFQTHESEVTSLKYQSSTASSISGHPAKVNADDSGISGITTSEKATTFDTNTLSSSSTNSQFPTLSPDAPASSSCSQLLPTVREDSELSFPGGARPKTSSSSAFMSRSVSSLPATRPSAEVHPVSLASASFPYHAHSSTWNPVSRQDSELQSQSSGAAVDDTTYSSMFKPDKARPVRPSGAGSKKVVHQQAANTGKKDSTQFIPRPKIPLEPFNLATSHPSQFAKQLMSKLSKLEVEQAKENKLRGILDLNKTKSSIHQPDYDDLESDQSILDEHVDRVFNEEASKAHNVSSAVANQFDSSRLMSASFHAGYRTLDSARHHHANHFGIPSSSMSHYRGDLAYYPSRTSAGATKSYSDTDFGLRMSSTTAQLPFSMAPPTYQTSHGSDRVNDWLKTTSLHHDQSQPAFVKTSPRGSGRSNQKRARSQDRFGQQPQQLFSAYSAGPHLNQLQTSYIDQSNASMVVNEASRRLASRQQQSSLNQSLPVHHHHPAHAVTAEFTSARYTFPQSKDNTPFLVRIPGSPPVTLGDVKRHLPKKSVFRFFFKTEMDGEEVFQEETIDASYVPLWNGSVVVQCRVE